MRMTLSSCNPGSNVTRVYYVEGGTVRASGTHIERVVSTVENCVGTYFVRGEGRANIQLAVLNKEILVKRGRHFKFVVTESGKLERTER